MGKKVTRFDKTNSQKNEGNGISNGFNNGDNNEACMAWAFIDFTYISLKHTVPRNVASFIRIRIKHTLNWSRKILRFII